MVVETVKYVFGGSCLSYLNGKAIFVPFSLPSEKLEVEIVESKKKYSKARIVRVLQSSPHRCQPLCSYFYLCGSCNMQMMCYEEQWRLKCSSAIDSLSRFKVSLPLSTTSISNGGWQYRVRFQFHIHKGRLSFMAHKSSHAVDIESCPIACKEINDYLKKKVVFDDTLWGSRLHVVAYDGRVYVEGREKELLIEVLGYKFRFSPNSFFQSNIKMLEHLVNILSHHIGECERLLDFYAGVGTFSLFFAKRVKELHVVEWNRDSISYAKLNLEENTRDMQNKLKCFFYCFSSNEWSKKEASRLVYDVAIVDPPRSGIDRSSIEWFCKRKVKKICYISCDPVTFARDASILTRDGSYKLTSHYLLDFYPQTHHIESLGIFIL